MEGRWRKEGKERRKCGRENWRRKEKRREEEVERKKARIGLVNNRYRKLIRK